MKYRNLQKGSEICSAIILKNQAQIDSKSKLAGFQVMRQAAKEDKLNDVKLHTDFRKRRDLLREK